MVYQAKLKQPPYSNRVIKVIEKKNVKDLNSIKEEVEILKRLDHPNIVKLYEFYEDRSAFYLVLEYIVPYQACGAVVSSSTASKKWEPFPKKKPKNCSGSF